MWRTECFRRRVCIGKGGLLPLNLLHHPSSYTIYRTVCITVYGSIIEFLQPIQLRACESYSRPVGSS
jgi:hypothetical protein